MKTLEEIFSEYFNCPTTFRLDGELTDEGIKAYSKMTSLIGDLTDIGILPKSARFEDRVDEIISGGNY